MRLIDIDRLREIAKVEFSEIVVEAFSPDLNELRIILVDGSSADLWFSIYRHDNAPHKRWRTVKTFPKHFHRGNEEQVTESYIGDDPEEGFREFLAFVREKLGEEAGGS